MSKAITYTFSVPARSNLTVTIADIPTSVLANDGKTYQGYIVTGISGTFNDQTVTGPLGPGGVASNDLNNAGLYDNTIFVDPTSGDGGRSLFGIDTDGLGFSTTAAHYSIYYDGLTNYSYQSTNVRGNPVTLAFTNEFAAVCFAAGTYIETVCGEVPVEQLQVGDVVVTAAGRQRPIVWIGTSDVILSRGKRTAATPVIVRKAALADNVPNRDLHITKAHSLCIDDDILIPVEFLVNHRSIIWDDHARTLQIYHIELEEHDVLLANGVPAESYRDDGNRWLFQNGNTGWDQPPKPPCLSVLTGGARVDAAWRRFLDRSGPRPGLPLTDDSDLHLVVDGVRFNAGVDRDGTYVFRLSWRPKRVRIRSRAGAPDELGLARDPRMLGIALYRVELCHSGGTCTINADDQRLCDGFHPFEADNGFRWTDGDAALPDALFDSMTTDGALRVRVGGAMRYPLYAEAAAV